MMVRHMVMQICGMIGLIVMLVNQSDIFHDIAGHWAEPKIEHLVYEGIVKGYPDQTFHPNVPITRAEAAMIVSQLQQSKHETSNPIKPALSNYQDEEKIPGWAREAIADVTKTRIMKGYTDNTFRPHQYVSRKEAVQIIRQLSSDQTLGAQQLQDTQAGDRNITRAEFCTLLSLKG